MGNECNRELPLCRCVDVIRSSFVCCGTHLRPFARPGTLLADLLAAAGVTENRTPNARDLHIHFESTQDCEDDTYYAASLPLEMAL